MSSLAARQSAFLAHILDEDAPPPLGWARRQQDGMAIYRNNYRTALIEALRDTYQRTERWVGEEAFQQAAAHHIITRPPTSWTLDDAGEGFDLTLAELFADDAEVGELAWVEWSMQRAFSGENAAPMTFADFAVATTGFVDADWDAMQLRFIPRLASRTVVHNLAEIWNALADENCGVPDYYIDTPMACHVFREGEKPVFVMAAAHETDAITAMLNAATFGEICGMLTSILSPEDAASEAGAMLGRWIHQGMVQGLDSFDASAQPTQNSNIKITVEL
jgi:hypothetical protein